MSVSAYVNGITIIEHLQMVGDSVKDYEAVAGVKINYKLVVLQNGKSSGVLESVRLRCYWSGSGQI